LLALEPDQSTNQMVSDALIAILNHPDDKTAYRAPPMLTKMRVDLSLVVDELIPHLKNPSSLVATGAAQALCSFTNYAAKILPPLWDAHNDPQHRPRTWVAGPSLKKLDPEGAAKAGLR
jgi:hypothetical protein